MSWRVVFPHPFCGPALAVCHKSTPLHQALDDGDRAGGLEDGNGSRDSGMRILLEGRLAKPADVFGGEVVLLCCGCCGLLWLCSFLYYIRVAYKQFYFTY